MRPPVDLHRDIKTALVDHVDGAYQKPIGLGGRRWGRGESREGWCRRNGGGSDGARWDASTYAKTAISG